MKELIITGSGLKLEDVADVALSARPVALSGEALAKVAEARRLVEALLAEGRLVYGVNTGVGKLSDVTLSGDEIRQLQVNILRSHAAGVGEPLAEAEVRAAMLLRANALARGRSGVRPVVLETIVALLNRGVHPVVPARGSCGASGDLAPAAHLGLALIGEGEAFYRGRRMPARQALSEAGIAPLVLEAKEGLSIVNGTQFMAGLGALAALRAEHLVDTADVAGALSLESLLGTDRAFDPRIQAERPHRGQIESAEHLRRMVAESGIVASHRECRRVQDAYSLRCMPQVHGAARDCLRFARAVLETEINSATDNPLVFAAEGEVLAGGNFHGAPLAYALDLMAIVLADLGTISERRIERLVNPDLSGLPAFLSSRPGLGSGFMLAQVTAAALASENKILAHPASVDSIPTSGNKEDHVSMGMAAALKLNQIIENVEAILAIELLCACQGIDFLRPLEPGRGSKRAYALLRSEVPSLEEDRPLSPDIARVREMIRAGAFSRLLRELI